MIICFAPRPNGYKTAQLLMHVYVLMHRSAIDLTLPMGVFGVVQTVCCGQLAAVVELNLNLENLQQDDAQLLQAVLAHDRVIRELFLQTTILPLRFTTFPTRTTLIADLETKHDIYLRLLERLHGKAECTIKLIPVESQDTPVSLNLKGKDYFLAKKRQHQEQQLQRDQQEQEFNTILRAIADHYPLVAQPDSQQAFVLIEHSGLFELQQKLSHLQAQVMHWQLKLGEPLPPFHFVQESKKNE